MRQYLLAVALAAVYLIFTATGHAGASYADGFYGHYQQSCITKRIRTEGRDGRMVTKRVRICQ